MRNRALLSALAVCLIAAGCDSKPAESAQPKVAAVVTPLPPPAPQPPAASANQDAPAQVAQSGTTKSGAPTPPPAKKAAPPIPPGLKGCTQGNCKISVTVTGTGSGCQITATPDPRGVFKNNKNDFMEWKIDTSGWEFDANGIDFPADPEFTDGQPAGTQKYKVKNRNGDATLTSHAYTINLKDASGAKCSKDPSVVNDVEVSQ